MSVKLCENPEYGFAVGRVRALETALLDRGRYDRLIRTRSVMEFVSALAETSYSRFASGDDRGDAGRAFVAAAEENFAFFRRYLLDVWLLDLFRLQADIHNLKVIIKRRLIDEAPSAEGLLNYGRWSNSELSTIAAGEHSDLPLVAGAVRRLLADFELTRDPAGIDSAVDQLGQALALDMARPSDFMTGYFRLHADLENLRTLVRVRLFAQDREGGGSRDVFSRALLPGGSLTPGHLTVLVSDEWDALVGRFASSPFRQYLEEGVASALRQRSLLRMERLGRELELLFLRQARYATFGYEPLVTFFMLQQNELRNLRLLYAAKQASLPDEQTQELVAYVD